MTNAARGYDAPADAAAATSVPSSISARTAAMSGASGRSTIIAGTFARIAACTASSGFVVRQRAAQIEALRGAQQLDREHGAHVVVDRARA